MIIGITGGIGSGKSAISKYLQEKGEKVICADEVAKSVVLPGAQGAEQIRRIFGDGFFDNNGYLKRKDLADYVFADNKKLDLLNKTLHPIIIKTMFEEAKNISQRVFFDAALLIKANMQTQIDYVWLVVSEENLRIQRVMIRDSANKQSVVSRIQKQMTDKDMMPHADEIIINNGDRKALYAKIDELLNKKIYNEDS